MIKIVKGHVNISIVDLITWLREDKRIFIPENSDIKVVTDNANITLKIKAPSDMPEE